MKGQFFFLGAVIIVIGLILLKSLHSFYFVIEENRHLAIRDDKVWNIQREYVYAAGIGRMNNVRDDYLFDLSQRFRNDTDIKVLYLLIDSNDTGFSVSTGNFLRNSLNATLVANTSSSVFSLQDKERRRDHFDNAVNITFSYTLANETFSEVVNFTVNATKLFYDIELFDDEYKIRVKDAVIT
jgi:hypothetical protein